MSLGGQVCPILRVAVIQALFLAKLSPCFVCTSSPHHGVTLLITTQSCLSCFLAAHPAFVLVQDSPPEILGRLLHSGQAGGEYPPPARANTCLLLLQLPILATMPSSITHTRLSSPCPLLFRTCKGLSIYRIRAAHLSS